MPRISSFIRVRTCALLAAIWVGIDPGAAGAVGEAVNGFPNWAERVIHQWVNRTRVDPQLEMDLCGDGRCLERACYSVKPPLSWHEALNRAARFHSDAMVRQSFFAHTSACTLVSNINSLYPASCNGSASCACVGGTRACAPTCTSFSQRVQLFGGSPSGEIIASPSDPNTAFYLWLYEQGDTAQCVFTSRNGHRWLILQSTGAFGAGVAGYSTGEFGSGSTPATIPSGAHYPQQAAAVEAWANWYAAAGPSLASVNVEGTCTPMTLRRGAQTNGAWSATVSGVGSGCHRYYFSFRDAAGTTVTYPTTGSLAIGSGAACPDWDAARPAACPGGGESPSPSPLATASTTATASRTATATASATPTRTGPPTSTATATMPPTPIPTATPTPTLLASGADIGGSVRYYGGQVAVAGAVVRAGTATSASTDASGRYVLRNVPATDVVVTAERIGSTGGAISPLDAAWVLQAVVGLRSLSAEQLLACDVTGNGSASALDATFILQRTVGLLDRLPVAESCDSDWAFIPEPAPAPGQTLIQPRPGSQGCTPGGIAYATVAGTLAAQDFAALVFGDCTGNWRPPAAASARLGSGTSRVTAGALHPVRAGRVALSIAPDSTQPIQAMQVRVSYDASVLRVVHTRLVGPARDAMVATNADPPGTLHIAIASAASFAAAGRPIAVVVFDLVSAAPIPTPVVSSRIE